MTLKKFEQSLITACLCISSVLISACQTTESSSGALSTRLTELQIPQKATAAKLLENRSAIPNTVLAGADMVVASKQDGLLILDKSGEVLSQFKGYFTTIDYRVDQDGLLIAAVDGNLQQAIVTDFNADSQKWGTPLVVPKPRFKIEDACLYQDGDQNRFVFLVGEEGLGEQWLVADADEKLPKALLVRSLSFPPESSFCHVDDSTHTLYVNEKNVGLWAYAAHGEAELSRQPVGMIQPFGDIEKNVSGMAVNDHQVLALDAESKRLHRYDALTHQMLPAIDLAALNKPKNLSSRLRDDAMDILIQDGSALHSGSLKLDQGAAPKNQRLASNNLPTVMPLIQTTGMPSLGDAADDPAIWVHPSDATKSQVLGTDKQGGLAVYNLDGQEIQYLSVGRLNNVDVRSKFKLNGTLIDLAVASNRDHNSLHLFSIDRQTGLVTELDQLATDLNDMYGICLFKDKKNQFFAIVNDKDGRFAQYLLSESNGKISADKVRTFSVETQPEGCVADDESEQLYIGEENVAVWGLNANADAPATMTKVTGINDFIYADIEGLAVYRGKKNSYIVISSQGNDSYVVLDALPPFKFRGAFSIGLNAKLQIDGASETDGLEVTSADLSGNDTGPWRLGMLVVQDGRKRMPEGSQNFKYVPWTSIAEALSLD